MSKDYTKTQLQRARKCIGDKDFEKALKIATDVLSFEASNYNAQIFSAVALSNLGRIEESEEVYVNASQQHPELPLAYQGLTKLYEDTQQWEKLKKHLMEMLKHEYAKNDAHKLAENLQKLMAVQRAHGTSIEVTKALRLVLPESPYYSLLSDLPDPEPTQPSPIHSIQLLMQNSLPALEEITAITEQNEQSAIASETDKRRTRLTGKVMTAEETQKAVQAELMGSSKLPSLYNQILAHPHTSDALRRWTESKLLLHFYTFLISVTSENTPQQPNIQAGAIQKDLTAKRNLKAKLRETTWTLACNMVLIKVANPLAWSIKLNWSDVASPSEYDKYDLSQMISIFPPDVPMVKLASCLLSLYSDATTEGQIESKQDTNEVEADNTNRKPETLDVAQAISEGIAALPDSLFAHVVASSYYLFIKDYHSLSVVCEAGLQVLNTAEQDFGQPLSKTRHYLTSCLATAYVHVDAPIHHRKALRLIETVLDSDPSNVLCLLSRGYILSIAEKWQEAYDIFNDLLSSSAASQSVALEARAERAWCLVGLSQLEEAERELEAVLDVLYKQSVESEDLMENLKEAKGKTWWRLGRCFWAKDGDFKASPEYAYTSFTESIRICPTFASSFCWLGKYYLEITHDADQAIRLFQKALDLDAGQEEAGQILADLYAKRERWSMVEVVARRIVSVLAASSTSETALSGTLILEKYAWAWRAIGMADNKSHRYTNAIVALQRTLRGTPDDFSSWLQLGIAYKGAGKHIASLKAFSKVIELDSNNWAAYYLAADVQRMIGLLDASIENLNRVQDLLPSDVAAKLILAETYLSQARSQLESGFLERALSNYSNVLATALDLVHGQHGATAATKILADCLFDMSSLKIPSVAIKKEVEATLERFDSLLTLEAIDQHLPEVAPGFLISSIPDVTFLLSYRLSFYSVMAYKLKLVYEPAGSATQASAWADLAIALFHARATYLLFHSDTEEPEILRWAVFCLREALRMEPRNPIFWNALGIASFNLSPRLSQHSFIKATQFNERSAIPWTHLGILYLIHEHVDLATKAFLKAQVLDPEWPNAWLGQACLAAMNGDEAERHALTTHAWVLAAGSIPVSDLEYTKLALSTASHGQPALSSAANSIQRYLNHAPSDSNAKYLSGILFERLDAFPAAIEAFTGAASMFEAKYEANESDADAKAFMLSKLAEGRAFLSRKGFEEAVEALKTCLDLIGEGITDEDTECKIQALMLLGVAQSQLEQKSDLSSGQGHSLLQEAKDLAETHEKPIWIWRVSLMWAKSLWSTNEQGSRAEAADLLLNCINNSVTGLPNLEVITTLAAMSIINQDSDLLEAAISELESLSMDLRIELDPSGAVEELLVSHHLLGNEPEEAIRILEKAIHARPLHSAFNKSLAGLLISLGREEEASRLIDMCTRSEEPDPELARLKFFARRSQDEHDRKRDEQLATFLDPVNTSSVLKSQG